MSGSSIPVYAYDPELEGSIVVNTREFDSEIDDFHNYRGWKTNPSIPHNKIPKVLRLWSEIKFIVLHETSADSGIGFNPPYTAHFVVMRDGKVCQFNDLVETELHADIFNAKSIGIEFVNREWEDGRSVEKNAIPARLEEENGYLHAFWGHGYNIYKLPPVHQLEKVVTLLKRLLGKKDEGFPAINPEWLQFVSYDDVTTIWEFVDPASVPPTEDAKKVKQFFIFSHGYDYMIPTTFDTFASGILSHDSISNVKIDSGKKYTDENAHTDGSFIALYSWLRIVRMLDQDEAFSKVKDLFKNHMIKARTRNELNWQEKENGVLVTKSGKRNIYLLHVDL